MFILKNKEDLLDALYMINKSWCQCHVDLDTWANYFGLTIQEASDLLTVIQSIDFDKNDKRN